MRKLVLFMPLIVSYMCLVPVLRMLMKLKGREPLETSMGPSISSYWVPIRIDSGDPSVYLGMGGSQTANDGVELVREYRRFAAATSFSPRWLILQSILPWRWLASGPEESELSSDLYVMF